MSTTAYVPRKYQQVYTLATSGSFDFERARASLVTLTGAKDVHYNNQLSPPELILLTDGTVDDTSVQKVASQFKKFAIDQ
ncbi:MAG: hypothetical protein AAF223_06790 [Bacteroidota bacterium]